MVKVDVEGGVPIYIDGYMKSNLDICQTMVKKKFDMVAIYFGMEGGGKTTIALQHAYYVDSKLTIDKVVFNPIQFEEAVHKAEPLSAIVWDEADDLGRHWADRMLQTMKRLFKRIRKKQLYVFLVTPTVFDLNKYFIIHRARYIVQVYTDKLERGYFKFYTGDRKRMYFLQGYKMWNDNAWEPDFRGRFTDLPKGFPIDLEAYEAKKDAATLELNSSDAIGKRVEIYEGIARRLYADGFPTKRIAYWLDKSQRQVERYIDLSAKNGVFPKEIGDFDRDKPLDNLPELKFKMPEADVE